MPSTTHKISAIAAPLMTLGILLGAAYIQRDQPKPHEAEDYHARARAAVNAIPLQMANLVGSERPPMQAAIEVLKPNVIRNIELIDPRPVSLQRPESRVSLSVVHCKRAEDMLGHYPRECYPMHGDTLVREDRRHLMISSGKAAESVNLTEYTFERTKDGKTYRRIVYNFMIAPSRKILADMKELREAAEDYEYRYYGAAQFQVVFDSLAGQELKTSERDEIFLTVMRSCFDAVITLKSGRPL
jgi:hypothetical protein